MQLSGSVEDCKIFIGKIASGLTDLSLGFSVERIYLVYLVNMISKFLLKEFILLFPTYPTKYSPHKIS